MEDDSDEVKPYQSRQRPDMLAMADSGDGIGHVHV